jgi:YVTN family beta-propeller protein
MRFGLLAYCFLMFAGCIFCINAEGQKGFTRSIIKAGIRLDVSLFHVKGENAGADFTEGENVRFRFKISDTVSGKGFSGASLAAWMDRIKSDGKTVDCRKKVKSYIEGGFLTRPEVDLNIYYVLTLNGDNTINVVNPLFGFGGSQLLTQLQLPAPGYDWVIKEDQSKIFVSTPAANKIAVINTGEMKIDKEVTLEGQPGKLLLQADEHYVWVSYDFSGNTQAKSGVVIIDAEKNTIVKNIITGAGPHEIIEDVENRLVYVSNTGESTISIIDMKTLSKIKDIELKDKPVSLAWSSKAQALYVVKENSSAVSVIDGKNGQIIREIKAEPGIKKICFSPNGRNGFVINPKNNTVNIIDAATNRIVQTADVEAQPDQISFTDHLVYVRHRQSEIISMIPLDVVGREGVPVTVADFNGGQNPPSSESPECGAIGIVQAPGNNSVLVSNYKDQSVYYYQEGMAAPMGSFSTYGKNPKAVMVIDRSIKEKGDGIYETVARLGFPGVYDLSIFNNVPLIMECFQVNVLPDPVIEKEKAQSLFGQLSVKYQPHNTRPVAGETVTLTFQMIDIKTSQPVSGLRDIRLKDIMTEQNKNKQTNAKETAVNGTYTADIEFADPGLYYVYIECPSRGLTYNNSQFLILYATKAKEIKQ